MDAAGIRGRRISERLAACPQVYALGSRGGWRISGSSACWCHSESRRGGASALLVLFADVVYFLVLVAAGIGAVFWLPAFYFLYLLIEAVFVYRAPEVLVVAVVSAIFCVAVQSQNEFTLRRTTVVAGALAYAFAVYKRRLESRMEELERETAETQESAGRARETERQRIASDFHDGPLQSFISLQMRLEILRKLLERDFGAGMDDLKDLQTPRAATGERAARVRPQHAASGDAGVQPVRFGPAHLRELPEGERHPGVFRGRRRAPRSSPEEMASEVIQMLREALHNVLKHAGATRVAVSLERVAKTLELSVDDNGGGFHFSGVYTLDELELLRLGPASLSGAHARSMPR